MLTRKTNRLGQKPHPPSVTILEALKQVRNRTLAAKG